MQLPLFEPASDWKVPTSLPHIPTGVVLAVDTETRDNGLANDRGPGWATRDGHIAGVSVAWDGESHYIPMRHPETNNLPPETVMAWLQDAMARSDQTVFHNGGYDTGWLATEGCVVDGDRCEDTQHASVMVNENHREYNLDAACKREGVPGKDKQKLKEAAAAFGLDPMKDMWRLPAKYVGGYGAQDAAATLGLWDKLKPQLASQGVEEAYRLEMDILPLCNEMRRRGIRVNEERADQVQRSLRQQLEDALFETTRQTGSRTRLTIQHLNSPDYLERLFKEEGLDYPRTPKTRKGSFKSDWLSKHEHWLPQAVVRCRQLNDLAEKFIGNYILRSAHLGRIHSEIHQLRDDDGGTRTYRFSYSNPPLQQLPARTKNGLLIRSILEPEPDCLWDSEDYSQQEPRLAVHYASVCGIPGAEDAVRYYCDDPGADFHTMVAELTGLIRKQAKIINLGIMYGMGLAKLAYDLQVSLEEAKLIIMQYNERMPFIKKLSEFCEGRASQRGFIRLLDGARCRFDMWEKKWGDYGGPQLSHERAVAEWGVGSIKRAGTRKAFNSLIQGGSARQTKMAMRACYREGLIPLIQLHDELGFSVSDQKTSLKIREIMQTVVKLKIPMKVDGQYGFHWGQASEELDDKKFKKGTPTPSMDELRKWGPTLTNEEIVLKRVA